MPRLDSDPGCFRVTCAGYTIGCTLDGLPSIYVHYEQHAALAEEFALHERNLCCLVHLDVMGNKRSFTLRDGPPKPR